MEPAMDSKLEQVYTVDPSPLVDIADRLTLFPRILPVLKSKILLFKDDQPYTEWWFCLDDVAKALGYDRPDVAVRRVFHSNPDVLNLEAMKSFGEIFQGDVLGGNVGYPFFFNIDLGTMFLSEFGLYYFIQHSSKPKARRLQRWVTQFAMDLYLKSCQLATKFDVGLIPPRLCDIKVLDKDMEVMAESGSLSRDDSIAFADADYKFREELKHLVLLKDAGEREFETMV